jgi:mono/diheme cytochrome c family protein
MAEASAVRRVILGFAATVIISLGLAAFLSDANGTDTTVPGTDIQLTAGQAHGRELFATTCGNCHTLNAARAVGAIGPNLDQLAGSSGIPASLVAQTIRTGRATAVGIMPAALFNGPDAQDIASFVSRVAGKAPGPRGY